MCFPVAIVSLTELGVGLFTTISKQGMDFQIHRDHYSEVYCLPLWLLPIGGACRRALPIASDKLAGARCP